MKKAARTGHPTSPVGARGKKGGGQASKEAPPISKKKEVKDWTPRVGVSCGLHALPGVWYRPGTQGGGGETTKGLEVAQTSQNKKETRPKQKRGESPTPPPNERRGPEKRKTAKTKIYPRSRP
jgi:hypothetical protein